jgi:hypothetical protein
VKTRTRSITIAAEPRAVFAYISRPENLPAWAPAFAESVRAEDDYWIATTSRGETRFVLRADEGYGIVDFLGLISADAYALRAPTRVVPNGPKDSEYLFTLFQAPRESEDAFGARLAVLCDELVVLRDLLQSGAAS